MKLLGSGPAHLHFVSGVLREGRRFPTANASGLANPIAPTKDTLIYRVFFVEVPLPLRFRGAARRSTVPHGFASGQANPPAPTVNRWHSDLVNFLIDLFKLTASIAVSYTHLRAHET